MQMLDSFWVSIKSDFKQDIYIYIFTCDIHEDHSKQKLLQFMKQVVKCIVKIYNLTI